MSLQRHSLDEIWNSEQMRGIRRDMVEGRQVKGCGHCYEEEARGGVSMRTRDNAGWEGGWLNEDGLTIDKLKTLATENDFRLPTMPASLEIETGNLCNLKCRMCSDGFSTRIARDAVHSSWTVDQWRGTPYHDKQSTPRQLGYQPFSIMKNFLGTEVRRNPDQLKRLYFIGGEPLLVREIEDVLQLLIDTGQSRGIDLAVVSNGTVTDSWLKAAPEFRRLDLAISIDGFGKYYDYIRYPCRWDNLVENIQSFKAMPNVYLGAAVTIQVYNALNITDLFRYLDSIKMGFYAYPLDRPRYLNIMAMPAEVRLLAAERLREYHERDCLPKHRDVVLGLVKQFEPPDRTFDARLLHDLMLFTNDLDATRGQSIHDAHGELVDLLSEAGFVWTSETLHAPQQRIGAQPNLSRVGQLPHRTLVT